MTNVVVFPRAKRDGTPPQTIEEVLDNVELARREHAEYVIDGVSGELFGMLQDEGMEVFSDDMTKDVALVVEAIRALVHKSMGYDHALHTFSDGIFNITDISSENETTTEE